MALPSMIQDKTGGVIRNYLYRAKDEYERHAFIKTICNPRVVKGVKNAHCCLYEKDWYAVSENGSAILKWCFHDSMCRKLRLNHYYYKSKEDLLRKLRRGWPDKKHEEIQQGEIAASIRAGSEECNEVYDPCLYELVQKWKNEGKAMP